MPNSEVIAAVSETLRVVLQTAMEGHVAVVVKLHDFQLDAPTAPTLTIFLFEVGEDPSARNRPHIRETEPPNMKIRKPPMALLLRYLLTSWGGDAVTQQKILGRAMQTLYDKAILSGPDLQGGDMVLKNTDEALKVTLSPMTLEEHTRVWNAVQKPYRLSVSYEVRVVNLDSEDPKDLRPVTRRTLDSEELETR